jgi:hypothetical protein
MSNGFKQSRRISGSEKGGGGGDGSSRMFSLLWTPTVVPTRVHFVRPEKMYPDPVSGLEFPWYRGRRHWLPRAQRYLGCGNDQCLVCAHANPAKFNIDGVAPDPDCAKSPPKGFNAVGGLIEEPFHLVDMPRKDGTGTYKSRERCTGRTCKHCAAKAPKVFGNRFYYSFSTPQWRFAVEPVMEKVERFCRCGGYRYPSHYACEKCGEVIIDMTNQCASCGARVEDGDIDIDSETHRAECRKCQTSWSLLECEDPELEEAANNPVRCPKCGHTGYPSVVLVCTTDGCTSDPYDIFDVSMVLRKDSNDKKYHLVVDEWKIKEPDPRLFDAKYQGGDDIAEKIAEKNKQPLPLEQLFAPDPPNVQAKLTNLPNILADYNTVGETRPSFRERDR